jgi:hypothetical protein
VPQLLLGPLLRYVDATQATIWVEVDTACEVEILGVKEPTFCVCGHHYALVHLEGLEPGSTRAYEVALDGERVWPIDDWHFPPSVIRTVAPGRALRLSFGSCRVAVPHVPPWTLTKDANEHGREVDALHALALRMRDEPHERWPDALLLIGDQVYADEDAPRTRAFIRGRRDTSQEPGEQVLDYEEYTRLYRESWSEPSIRWLLSTVSSAMLFDDHDVHDDWNTSQAWLDEMRAKPWWQRRITAALSSYYVHQQLGNLSPEELAGSELWAAVRAAPDAGALLHDWAAKADADVNGSRWSYARELGDTRIVMLDSREGRVLDEGDRRIVDEHEWRWIEAQVTGGVEHLVIADTLPVFFTPAFHHAEAFSEAICGGAWGPLMAKAGERMRRAFDLEHWAAFDHSFRRMCELVAAVARGERGPAPRTITLLAGDVHHAYLAEVEVPGGTSAVWQATCSPFRNPLDAKERKQAGLGCSPVLARVGRALAGAAGVAPPPLRWEVRDGPVFDNQVGTLELGEHVVARIERTTEGGWREARLTTSLERRLA